MICGLRGVVCCAVWDPEKVGASLGSLKGATSRIDHLAFPPIHRDRDYARQCSCRWRRRSATHSTRHARTRRLIAFRDEVSCAVGRQTLSLDSA
jgi:hypothetical protein